MVMRKRLSIILESRLFIIESGRDHAMNQAILPN